MPAITPAAAPSTEGSLATRFAGLDGLRAIAVLLVILFHLTPGALQGGYLGVDVFFVISGFLITSLLLRERWENGRIALGGFWLRRARRLLPALVLLLLVCSTAAFLLGGDVLVGLAPQVLSASTFSYNWIAIAEGASYFDATTPELFRNLWSLAVEEQFYLLWPLLLLPLLLIRNRAVTAAVLGLAGLASALAMALLFTPGSDATRVYYGTDTHSFGLLLGAALAMLLTARPRQSEPDMPQAAWRGWITRARPALTPLGAAAVLALIALSVTMPAESAFTYRGGLLLVALLTLATIAIATRADSPLGRWLDAKPLRWVGERSYGLYLWHWPVFVLLGAAIPAWTRTDAGRWWLGGVALVITAIAAEASFRWLETPIRREGFLAFFARMVPRGLPRPRAILSLAGSLALVASLALTVAAVVRDPGAGEAQASIEQGQAAIQEAAKPTPPEKKGPPPLPGGDRIVAIGDSVLLAAAPEVQAAFPGILIDAVVSRQMAQAPEIAQGLVDSGAMRSVLVIGLGTNGWIGADTLESVRQIVGPSVEIVVVNIQAPREWEPEVNAILADFAQRYRDVELANWHDAIQPRLDVLSSDDIHPGGPLGGQIYAGAVKDALQRLAELPPLLGVNDYGLAPHPS